MKILKDGLGMGQKNTAVRANEMAHKKIEEYEMPPMDEAIKAELDEFIAKRKPELEA